MLLLPVPPENTQSTILPQLGEPAVRFEFLPITPLHPSSQLTGILVVFYQAHEALNYVQTYYSAFLLYAPTYQNINH